MSTQNTDYGRILFNCAADIDAADHLRALVRAMRHGTDEYFDDVAIEWAEYFEQMMRENLNGGPLAIDICMMCGTPVSRVEEVRDDWWEHDEECPDDTPCYYGNSKFVGPEWAYEKLGRAAHIDRSENT